MLPASNAGAGMNLGFPDVCVTPVGPAAVPIPYPNMALNATAVPFSPTVLLSFVPALNMGAQVPMTLGDQAGTLSPFMGPGRYTMGNPKILVNALPAVNLLCPTTGNNMVNGLGAVVVPSVTNVFFTKRGAAPEDGLDGEALSRLARAARPAGALPAERLSGGVVYVPIPVFSSGLAASVHAALERIGASGVSALIFDLRGCPGGELLSAIELAGDFLDAGDVIATAVDGDGDEVRYRARGPRAHRLPLFLLVDRMTASAAEVLAGALQWHRRAVVIGERTYGKGTAQALVADDSSARYPTMAALLSPGGDPIEGRGVLPDVSAPPESSLDAALAAAGSSLLHDEVR